MDREQAIAVVAEIVMNDCATDLLRDDDATRAAEKIVDALGVCRYERLEVAAREVLRIYWPIYDKALTGLRPEAREKYVDAPIRRLHDLLEGASP